QQQQPYLPAPHVHTHSVLAKQQPQQQQFESLPSPASSVSPLDMKATGVSKRRAIEIEDDAELDSRTRRRLSVSFLVDC
ncbi:hypothetical protein BG004_004307, partial [Podila humilis]